MTLITYDEGEIVLDESSFSEGDNNGEAYLETTARLFRTGKHKGRNYTQADLDKMAASVTEPTGPRDWNVPVQLDHNQSARNTAGHVRKAFREGDLLRGVLRFCGEEAVKGVKSGNFSRLSISHRPDMTLHHVAVTPFPYLNDAVVGFSALDPDVADAIKRIAASLSNQNPPETIPEEEKPVAIDAKNKAETPTEDTPTPTPEPTPAPEIKEAAPAASFASVEDAQKAFSEQTKAQEARIAALEAQANKQAELIRFNELAGVVNEFSEAGKTLPVMRDAELALVQTFDDGQLALYRALKDSQPALVSFGVLGMQDSPKPKSGETADSESDAGAARARARQEKKGGK